MADIALLKASVLVPSGSEAMAAFEKTLAKLNAKATKYGLSPVTAGEAVRERFARRYEHDDNREVTRMYVVPLGGRQPQEGDEILHLNRVPLEYPIIALGSWEVLGKLEPFGEGRIAFAATDDPSENALLGRYREADPCCEHCNKKRQRKDTYVVRHVGTGETKQIGSTCLEDFTGIDPAKVLFLAQVYGVFKTLDDSYEHFMHGVGVDHGVRPVDFLRDALFAAEWQGGFVSSKRAKEEMLTPTYVHARNLADLLRRDGLWSRYRESKDRLLDSAQRVIDWWAAWRPTSEFERTTQQIVTTESLPFENKYLAFAAASIPAMDRALAKAATQAARAAHPSEHVGSVGEKMHQAMRLTGHHGFDSQFGWAYFVNFVDAEGNKYCWKTASPPGEFLDVEAKAKWFDGRFKVKKHDEYRDEKITLITHVKFDGWTPAPTLTDDVAAAVGAVESGAPRLLVVDVPAITKAFDDMGWRQQADLLLRDTAERLRDPSHDVWSAITLQDANGNPVGTVSFPTARPEPPIDGHLRVVVEPAPRDTWVAALEDAATHVHGMVASSDLKLVAVREGVRRDVGTVQWDALRAYLDSAAAQEQEAEPEAVAP